MRTLIFLILNLLFLSSLQAQTVERAAICEGVQNLNPIAETNQFKVGSKAYFWVKVTGAKVGTSLKLEWYFQDKLQYSTALRMKYSAGRTYSYKTLHCAGNWRAELKSPTGTLLTSITFTASTNFVEDVVRHEEKDTNTEVTKPVKVITKEIEPSEKHLKPQKLQLTEGLQLEITTASEVLLPPNYDKNKKYPVLFFLPATGGSGKDQFMKYVYQAREYSNGQGKTDIDQLLKGLYPDQEERKAKEFIVILPDGIGTTADHSWQGFSACIHRYEQRIMKDLEQYSQQYSIDKDKAILVGFSLGGDLSWAISHRYPYTFKGAVVMGSRCSYNEKGKEEHLAKHNFRYYITMGENESEVRLNVLKYARAGLDKKKIDYQYKRVPNGGHVSATFEQLKEAIDYVLFEE